MTVGPVVHAAVRTPARRRSRRAEILDVAVGLFAARGYHGVSMDDIGAAAGVTGPALYHHFAGKEAMLAAALYPVSESLLAGGRARVAAHAADPAGALAALVEFHVDFALNHPAVIALHLHELDRLPDEPRREIRRLQRLYVEVWVGVLTARRPDLPAGEARVLAHAAFGLMNSTPFLSGEVDRVRCATLLRAATLAVLRGSDVAGSDVAGSDVAGSDVAGPEVAGQDVRGQQGQDVRGEEMTSGGDR